MPKNVQKFANFQVYPQNGFKPRMIPTLKLTLNPIFVLIIITHAQVFETIKKHGGQGYLAAPYLPLAFNIINILLEIKNYLKLSKYL